MLASNGKTVLIVGAGIAGPTLAYWLRVAGFEPTLTERAPTLRTGGYVIDFWGLGYDLAERMGLKSDIHRAGYQAQEMRIVDDRGERVTGFGTGVFSELINGRYVTLRRSELSGLIFDKIKDTTETIFGSDIVEIQEAQNDVRVQFENGLFLFVFATDRERPPESLAEQKAMLHEIYKNAKWECPRILDELDRAQELYFDNVSQIKMRKWSRARVALIGDAAFCVSLLAGQGSALAMISAYVLAGELAEADEQYEKAFQRYEEVLRTYIEGRQQGAERFASAFAPKTEWGLWFRNRVIGAFTIPGLAKIAVGRDIIDTLQIPKYRWPALEQAQLG